MSDTPPYSEATVELVARAEYEADAADVTGTEMVAWPDALEGIRASYLNSARASLDALAAAGLLLPEGAEREHAVRYSETGHVTQPMSSAKSARACAKAWRTGEGIECEPVERLVTPWSPVPPEPKEGT